MRYWKFFLLSLLIIGIDQAVKLWVHFNMEIGPAGQIKVFGEWFKIHYILNPGMAFGLKLDAEYGKLLLSIFRIVATLGIAYYIKILVDRKAHQGLIWCVALILGGAVGNVVDSTFYGIFLSGNLPKDPVPPMALFHGQVIDMFYVDIWEGYLPTWIPLIGGDYYSFWPIFNVADASIFVGVAIILIFQRQFFAKPHSSVEEVLPNPENPTQVESTTP
ncbi:MAG: lipoprotein signal peptidase [Microscillaceae bacterium]|jgi:signal peptidase II|nr:lipoprotein signal peptidase [Microscillaceae bacterium]